MVIFHCYVSSPEGKSWRSLEQLNIESQWHESCRRVAGSLLFRSSTMRLRLVAGSTKCLFFVEISNGFKWHFWLGGCVMHISLEFCYDLKTMSPALEVWAEFWGQYPKLYCRKSQQTCLLRWEIWWNLDGNGWRMVKIALIPLIFTGFVCGGIEKIEARTMRSNDARATPERHHAGPEISQTSSLHHTPQ